MVRDIIFAILIYLIIGVVFAFGMVNHIHKNARWINKVYSIAKKSGWTYEGVMMVMSIVAICGWAYFLIISMVDT